MQATAKVIQLPTAALQPVVQKNGPGRYPKKIVSNFTFWRKWRDRKELVRVAAKQNERIRVLQSCIQVYETASISMRHELAVELQKRQPFVGRG